MCYSVPSYPRQLYDDMLATFGRLVTALLTKLIDIIIDIFFTIFATVMSAFVKGE